MSSILLGHANLELNISLSIANFLLLARQIQEMEIYPSIRSAAVGAALGCEPFDRFFPDQIKQELDQKWRKTKYVQEYVDPRNVQQVLENFFKIGPSQFGYLYLNAQSQLSNRDGASGGQILSFNMNQEVTLKQFIDSNLQPYGQWPVFSNLLVDTYQRQGPHRPDVRVARLRYLFEGLGQDMSSWFLDLKQPTYRLSDGFDWARGLAWALFAEDQALKSNFNNELELIRDS